ncbi:MAG: (d)CMP kinase, partial [Clostridia bacterium]|nr:(d)CMP kinase [Clostridia bacterium]
IPAVRLKLLELQRELALNDNVIMDGRDIGTYVLPNAQLKIFLTAAPEARAQRRFLELSEKGVQTTFEEVFADMTYRDKNDSGRDFAPLKPAEDSVLVDSTELTLSQTVEKITAMAESARINQ